MTHGLGTMCQPFMCLPDTSLSLYLIDLYRYFHKCPNLSEPCVNVSIRQGQILTYTYPDTYPFMHTSRACALYTYRKSKIDLRLTY